MGLKRNTRPLLRGIKQGDLEVKETKLSGLHSISLRKLIPKQTEQKKMRRLDGQSELRSHNSSDLIQSHSD